MLHSTLLYLFPNYRYGDWLLQDDGKGPYIKQWNRTEPEPTQAEIDTATPLAIAAEEKAKSNAPVLAEIAAIESTQARAIREHLLGDTLALDRLRAIDDKIKLARGKLKK